MMDTAAVRSTGESVDALGKRLQKTDLLLSPLPTGPKRPIVLPKGPSAEKQDGPNPSPFGPTLERSSSGLVKPRPQGSNNVGQRAAFFEAQIKAEDQAKTHDPVAAKLNRFRSLPTTIRIPRDEPRGRQISARESYEQHIREKMRQSMPPILQARYFGAVQRGKHNRTASSTKLSSPEPSPTVGLTVASFPGTATRAASYSVSTPSPTPSPRSSSSAFPMPALTPVANRSFPSLSLASSPNASSSFRSSYSTSFPSSSSSSSSSSSTPSSSFPSTTSTPSSSFPSTPTTSFPSSFGASSSFPPSSFPSTPSSSFPSSATPTSSSSLPYSTSSFTSASLFPSLKPINAVPLSPPARALPPLIPHVADPPSTDIQSPSRRVRPMARTWGLAAESKTGTAPPATNPEVFKDLMASKYRQSEGAHANKEANDERQPTLIPASPIIVDKSPLKDHKGSGDSKTSSFPPPIPELQVLSADAAEVDRSVWDDDVVVVSPEPGSADKINVWDIDDVCVVENPSPAVKEPSLLDKIKSVSMSEEALRFAEYALLDFVVVRLPETKTVKPILRAPAEKRGGRSIEFDLKQTEMPNCMYEQEEVEREEEEARKRQEEEEEEDSGSPLDDDEAEPVPQFLIDDGDDEDEGDGSGEEEDDPFAKKKPDINPLDAWKRAMEEKTLKLRELNESPTVPVASTPTGNLRTFRVAPRSWGGTTKTEDFPSSDPSPSVTSSVVFDNPVSSSLTPDTSSFPSVSETKDNDGDSSEEDANEPSLTAATETKQQRLARIKSKKKFMLDRAKSGGTITKGFGKNSVKMPDLTVTGESALEAWKRAMEDKTQKMKAIQAARVASSPPSSTKTLAQEPSTSQDHASSDVVVADSSVADASPTAAESGKRAFRAQPRAWKGTAASASEHAASLGSDCAASTSTPVVEATTASEDTFDAFSAWTKAMEEKAQKMKVATSARAPPGPPSMPQGEAVADEASGQRKRPVIRSWATASPSYFTNAMTENAASTSTTTSSAVTESSVEEPATPTEPRTPTRRMPRVQPRAWAGAAAAVLAEHKEEKESGVNEVVTPVANSAQSSSQGEKPKMKAESEEVTIDPLAEPITPRRMRAKVQPRNWGTASASTLAQAQAQPVSSET